MLENPLGEIKGANNTILKLYRLSDVPFEIFKSFIDSLKNEKKTWSLDKNISKSEQPIKTLKEYYNVHKNLISTHFLIDVKNNKIIGLINCDQRVSIKDPTAHRTIVFLINELNISTPKNTHNPDNDIVTTLSIVIKEEHQGQGLGTFLINLLLNNINPNLQISSNICLYTSVIDKKNIASIKAFKKNGFIEIGDYDPKGVQWLMGFSPHQNLSKLLKGRQIEIQTEQIKPNKL